MRLITQYELAALHTVELHLLTREVFNALARSAPGSADRRNCLASLENLKREIAARSMRP